MTVLVVSAHPDDETLGAGGTIARYTASGERVCWLVLGEGSTSRLHSRSDADAAVLQAQRHDCRRAAAVLGVTEVDHCEFPDNRFDSVDLLDVVKAVEIAVRSVGPETVITHHGGDLNVDHRITHEAVLAATRPLPDSPVRTVLAMEVPSSTEWGLNHRMFSPNVFVDIEATITKKLDALEEYGSEMRPFPHPRSAEAVRALATHRGASAGVRAAEAFQLIRAVRRP